MFVCTDTSTKGLFLFDNSIILASGSPRRRELLRQIGLDCTVQPADVDERPLPGESPEHYALRVALDKARTAAARTNNGIIIAADTIVVLQETILGKPADAADAARMLTLLSGRMHRVITGLTVRDASTGEQYSALAVTRVWFRALAPELISSYVASGEPFDKAGAYGIQERGALFVERIDGCYFNVVGLPLSLLAELLAHCSVSIL